MSGILLFPIAPDVVSDLFRKAQDYLQGKETTPSLDVQAGWALRAVSESLRAANGEEEFERAIELSSQPPFFAMLVRLRMSPAFAAIEQESRIASLRAPQVFDRAAYEFLSDLEEATALLLKLISPTGLPSEPSLSEMRKLIRATRHVADDAEMTFFTVAARYAVALLALSAASYVDEPWHQWKIGRLWRVGRESVIALGTQCGTHVDEVLNHIYTQYDMKLSQLPFDEAASDRAKAQLGLNEHATEDRAAG